MAVEIRLQDTTVVTGDWTQDRKDAADVGAHRHWVFQVRVSRQAVTTGTLVLQHAARNEEEAFVDIPNLSVSLKDDLNKVLVVIDPLRFLRCKVTNVNVSAAFMIDGIGR